MQRWFFRRQDKQRIFIFIGLFLVLGMGIYLGMQKMGTRQSLDKNTSGNSQTTVDTVKLSKTALEKQVVLSGQTVPEAQIDIAAKYQGKVVAVNVSLGQQVAAGDVLVVQDTKDADLSIAQNSAAYSQAAADAVTSEVSYQANYDKAKADYQRAVTNYERYQTLFAMGGVSREQLDASEQERDNAKAVFDTLDKQMNSNSVPAVIEAARATAQKAQYSVSAMEKQRDDLVLRAPRSGMIGYRQVEAGSMVSAGQKLLSIVDNSQLYVDCQVSEQDIALLMSGMDVAVQVDSLGKTVPGKLIYISPASSSDTQSFSVRISLQDHDPLLKGGMFARTVITSTLRQNTLVAPKDAVLEKNGKRYVFVVTEQNEVEERVVQVGMVGDKDVEILAGVNEGEQIAVNNLSRLRSGLKVKPNLVSRDNREAAT